VTNLQHSERLTESAGRLESLIAMCRAQAMNESRRYRITIYPDGLMDVRRQLDPLTAPHEYVLLDEGWGQMKFLLDDVWVESLLPLPHGPPPILVEDDNIEFTTFDETPTPVQDLEAPYPLDFEPNGSSASLRWVLRDADGRGLRMTLDGRLGRIERSDVERLEEADVERPPVVERPEEPDVSEIAAQQVGNARIGLTEDGR
jgi:hypothetical protein